jgi:hypothetical protein
MSQDLSISGDLPDAAPAAVRQVLADLGVPIRVHHEIDVEWSEPGIDIHFEGVLRPEGGVDYLITGSIVGERAAAIERVQTLAKALEARGIVYQLELDDERDLDGGKVVTLAHPKFPGYPH